MRLCYTFDDAHNQSFLNELSVTPEKVAVAQKVEQIIN